MNLKKLIVTILVKSKTYGRQEGRPDNRRLAKKRVQWLNEALCFESNSVLVENLVLRNPPLRQAAKRCASF